MKRKRIGSEVGLREVTVRFDGHVLRALASVRQSAGGIGKLMSGEKSSNVQSVRRVEEVLRDQLDLPIRII